MPTDGRHPRLTRRTVLLGVGSGTALMLLPARSSELVRTLTTAARLPAGDTFEIVRASDQLRLTVTLVNLARTGQDLVGTDIGLPSYLQFVVPSQHVDEQATTTAGSAKRMKHRAAGETRVVLEVLPPVPFTLESLLDWGRYALATDPRADLDQGGPFPVGAPAADVTSLELPEGLLLSPGADARFISQWRPVTRGAVTEEWTARLGRFLDEVVSEASAGSPQPVRALWTPGYPSAPTAITGTDPYLRPLSTVHRRHLVRAMGDATDTTEYPAHEPAAARRLWLGATGGWLDVEGAWEGTGLVAAWQHLAVTGRDVKVTVVTRGYLAPFGLPASVATVSERTWAVDSAGAIVAQLEQVEYLIIVEAPVASPRPLAPDGDRRSIFTDVRASGVFEMARGQIDPSDPIDTGFAFVPLNARGNPLKIPFTATDRAGHTVTFTMSCPFVDVEHAFATGAAGIPSRIVDYLNDAATAGDRDVPFADQRVAFADEITVGDGSTSLITDRIVFSAVGPPGGTTANDLRSAGQPAFFPSVEEAHVRDDATEALSGAAGGTIAVTPAQGWIDHGNAPANFGAVFLTMAAPSTLGFGGDASGLVSPSFSMGQFGQTIGQSVALPSAGSTWDPADALSGLGKLFGTISLDWLLRAFDTAADLAGDVRLPRFDVEVVAPVPFDPPSEICQTFDWSPEIHSVVIGGTRVLCVTDDLASEGLEPVFSGGSSLEFHLEHCVSLDVETAGEMHDSASFALTNVALQFPPAIPMLAVYLRKLSYEVGSDAKGEYDVDIAGIALVGPLNFLDTLIDLLPESIASFDIDLLALSVDAAFDIALPALSFGVFSIDNLRFGMGVEIPFDASPVLTRFSLGSRENPFALTIMGVGGTGSIEIEVAPHPAGVVRVEVVLGVLLQLAIDVIVARGSISAGFSMALEIEKVDALNGATGELEEIDEVTLTAALDCVGEVEVLGLITITIEFLLALEYKVNQRLLSGEVSVSVEVDATIVKKDVRFTVHQEFSLAGDGTPAARLGSSAHATALGSGDLTFASRFASADDWAAYCAAYA